MRSIFNKHRKIVNATIPVDAQPRGVHHTVKIEENYNETWNHIWSEIKRIGISPDERAHFESQEIYSYGGIAVKEQKQKDYSENYTGSHKALCNPSKVVGIRCRALDYSFIKNETKIEKDTVENTYENISDERFDSYFVYPSENEPAANMSQINTHPYSNSYHYHIETTENEANDNPEDIVLNDCSSLIIRSEEEVNSNIFFSNNTAIPIYYSDFAFHEPVKIGKELVNDEDLHPPVDSQGLCTRDRSVFSSKTTVQEKFRIKRRKNELKLKNTGFENYFISLELDDILRKSTSSSKNSIGEAMKIPLIAPKKQYYIPVN
ncbi:hypothetical protein WJR50_21755 [Catalinimonas sp. 4WD22]|uniref:hypothetical protein n=1 Tax=Catalinimonas locisalis TaxID=3133978 RepID=UPI0031010EBC